MFAFAKKNEVVHDEVARERDDTRTIPLGADAETARYLDPTVIIDDQTNRQIKRMVRVSEVLADDSWIVASYLLSL
jgi:hypothetical protein